MKVTLVIPCYNEELRLDTKNFSGSDSLRFIFINDGSTDGTLSILNGISSDWVKVHNLPKNLGKAEAVRQGMLIGTKIFPDSDWIGFWDADLATPLNQVEYMLMFKSLGGEEIDAIFGSRILRLGANIKRNFIRHILGRFFVTYSSILLGSKAYDSQCGAKLFRTSIVSVVFNSEFCSKWLFDMEIIQRLNLGNFKILECPLQSWRDVEGSKLNIFRDGFRAICDVVKIRMLYGKNN